MTSYIPVIVCWAILFVTFSFVSNAQNKKIKAYREILNSDIKYIDSLERLVAKYEISNVSYDELIVALKRLIETQSKQISALELELELDTWHRPLERIDNE